MFYIMVDPQYGIKITGHFICSDLDFIFGEILLFNRFYFLVSAKKTTFYNLSDMTLFIPSCFLP